MPLTTDEFCNRIAASRLLSADDARLALSSIAENERPTDGESLATLLVKAGKLTAFQAKRICDDKAESLILGNYLLLDRIGRGGMGDVFKAQHRRMKRVVALKVVKAEILDAPGALKRFQREVETVAKLDHPNVVTAHDADEANGIHFLVMQFVDGRDLSSVVKAKGPFSVPQAVDCILQAARGLAYAHEQGIVHRDVKPGNMLLDRKGVLKILDLGLATLMARDAQANDSLTGSEMIVGTLDYMAPEQAQSPKLADERSDIYSLGMTLWFLLTGRAAYEAETVVGKLLAHQQQPIPSLLEARTDTPAQLDDLFQRMVAKQPSDRPQSMQQVVGALEALQRGEDMAPALARAGNTDATVQLSEGSGGENLTQRRRGAEQGGQETGDRRQQKATGVVAATDAGAVGEQTASMVKPHEDTTANTKKPDVPIIVSTTKRRARRVAWQQYSLIGISAALFLVAAIGSPLIMLKLSVPTGSIIVTTDQPELEGAVVSLDGQTKFEIGKSGPQRAIRLAADDQHHTLFVAKEGFQPYSRQIRVTDSRPQSVFVHLSPIATSSLTPAAGGAAKSVAKASPSPQTPAPSPASSGFALEFNGKDSYVDLPTLRYDGSHPITLEATIVPRKGMGRGQLISNGLVALNVPQAENFRSVGLVVKTLGGYATSLCPLVLDRRMQIAAVVDGSQLRVFSGDTIGETYTLTEAIATADQPFTLGVGPLKGSFYSGVLDEVRISCVARYQASYTPLARLEPDVETLALYHFDEGQGEVLTDSSGNGHHGKIVNAKWVPGIAISATAPPPPPATGFALEFNGHDSYVDLPTLRYDGSHPITFEARFITSQVTEAGTLLGDMGEEGHGLRLQIPSGGGSDPARGIFSVLDGSEWKIAFTHQPLRANRRFHVAAQVRGRSLELYLDGKRQQSEKFSSQYIASEYPFMIGTAPLSDPGAIGIPFSGTIDEVRVSKVIRYTSGFTPPTRFESDADTLALYHFDEGQGDVLTDSSGNNHHGKIVNAKWVPGIAGGPPVQAGSSEGDPPAAIAPFDSEQARAHQKAWASYLGVPVEQTNSIGLKLRLIPPGEFMMGSTDEQVEAAVRLAADEPTKSRIRDSERPQHRVTIGIPLFAAATEVTIAQFRSFVQTAKYTTESERIQGGSRHGGVEKKNVNAFDLKWDAPGYPVTDESPVSQVTWNDCIAFCNWLSEHESLRPFYRMNASQMWARVNGADGYRLPTEAEWEYVCRAGTTTQYSFGDNADLLGQYAWYGKNAERQAHAVAQKLPNPFGLFDMHGNLWEWCEDYWDEKWYAKSPSVNPNGPSTGATRVLRGGEWHFNDANARSATRMFTEPARAYYSNGFRVVRTVPLSSAQPRPETQNRNAIAAAGFALEFNGKDSHVDLPTLRYDGSHPITIEANVWASDNSGAIMSARWLGLYSDHFITGSPGNTRVAKSPSSSRGKQLHVAGILNESSITLYLDGKLQNSVTLPRSYGELIEPEVAGLRGLIVGAIGISSLGIVKDPLLGLIDEIRVSNSARYSADFTPPVRFEADVDTLALYHFDEGQGDVLTDSSGNNHHGKIVNAKWVPGIAGGPPAPAAR